MTARAGRLAVLALYAASAALLVATPLWPSWTLAAREARTRGGAEAALQLIAAGEQAHLATHQAYATFGPGAGPQGVLPALDLGPAAADFVFDALLDPAGALRIRVVTRPEAVRVGRAVPLVVEMVLKDISKASQEGAP